MGTGERTTIRDLAAAIAAYHSAPGPHVTGQFRDGDVRHAACDVSHTVEHLDWSPQVSLADRHRSAAGLDRRPARRSAARRTLTGGPAPSSLLLLLLALVLVTGAAYVVVRETRTNNPARANHRSPRRQPRDRPRRHRRPRPRRPQLPPASRPSRHPRPGSPCPPGPARDLTVLSFNIHGGLGHDGYDLDRIVREVEKWRADVVLLQEVDRYRERTELDDQPLELAIRLDMFPAFGSNVRRPAVEEDGEGQEYGTLTLSRYRDPRQRQRAPSQRSRASSSAGCCERRWTSTERPSTSTTPISSTPAARSGACRCGRSRTCCASATCPPSSAAT